MDRAIKNLIIIGFLLLSLLVIITIHDLLQLPSKYLVIFYTSNLRGQINPFPSIVENRYYDKVGGLAFIKGFIDKKIEDLKLKSSIVLLLDTGDSIFGSPESSLTFGESIYNLLVKSGYKCIAIGNLDFEIGIDNIRYLASRSKLPFLACNYKDIKSASNSNTFIPYISVVQNNHKIGIIGLGHNELYNQTRPENITDIEILDLASSVKRAVSLLKLEGAELIILLSHHPIIDLYNKNYDFLSDIDIVIGDGMQESKQDENKPLFCKTPFSKGAGVGIVMIPYQYNKWDVGKAFNKVYTIDATLITPNKELLDEIAKIEMRVEGLLETQIGIAETNFVRNYENESTIGSLITDAMKYETKSDIALLNSGSIKADILAGTITMRNLYEVIPFENSIVVLTIKGKYIENILEHALTSSSTFLQSSGIKCVYDSSNPTSFKIIEILINSEPIDYQKEYQVAVSDFMVTNYNQWPDFRFAKNKIAKGLVRDALKNYILNKKTIFPDINRRFFDIKNSDPTLSIQALDSEITSLSEILKHDNTINSPFARYFTNIVRNELDVDICFIEKSAFSGNIQTVSNITPAQVISLVKNIHQVFVSELDGKIIVRLLSEMLLSKIPEFYFAGCSVELKNGNLSKIYLWESEFEEKKSYKVAFTSEIIKYLNKLGFTLSQDKVMLYSFDMRRTFINGVREINGKVSLKPALL